MRRLYSAAMLVPAVAVLFALPAFTGAMGYYTYLIYLIFLMTVLTIAWDFAGGLAGLFSLGNAAFFGVGAYAAAILVKAGYGMPIALLAAGVVAAGTAVVLSIAIKLRGIYFIMSTLFLAQIVQILMLNWTSVTGGNVGFYLPVPANFSYLPFYYTSLIMVLVVALAYHFIRRSWIGFSLRAIGNDEDAARSMGINPVVYKVLALAFAAFFTGIMGGIYANITLYITTSDAFSLGWSLNPMFSAIIGGVGTIWGGIIGAVIMTLLAQLLTPIGPVSIVIQSSIMVLIILVWPAGVYGTLSRRPRRGRVQTTKREGEGVVGGEAKLPSLLAHHGSPGYLPGARMSHKPPVAAALANRTDSF
jgi:ABC-type branched-subunit amino acid transport system permease subunit